MKRTISLSLAMVSTMLLTVGATRAAGMFDATSHGKTSSIVNPVPDVPSLPCQVGDENLTDLPSLPCQVGDENLSDRPSLPCIVGDEN